MRNSKPYILSIAGFDPSAGAGVLADIKTMEMLGCYGMSAITSNTIQVEDQFDAVYWVDLETLKAQIELLIKRYQFKVIKIGLIQFSSMKEVLALIKAYLPNTMIVWDPILSASAGFDFNQHKDVKFLDDIDWVTPNWEEVNSFGNGAPEEIAKLISSRTKVFLKGGHSKCLGKDLLFINGKKYVLNPRPGNYSNKHGSGCVLSSALACFLARDFSDVKAAFRSKRYIEKMLSSNNSKLAYHR